MTIKVKVIEAVCRDCKGTGLHVGLAVRDGAAVVCHTCRGTGCQHIEYEPFRQRRIREGIKWVYEIGAGVVVGTPFEEYGGMSAADWYAGQPFKAGMEARKYVCPARWYQQANYAKKPQWDQCLIADAFTSCQLFPMKDCCWEAWDKEFGEIDE